ncbi:5-formyltetrahydrofolate cyclo-ligase [Leucobacter sp. CSA1]|uniref:5-formyltetrahydrofolate cyclo-ligase n=1 Tax=Leucobacter chromiisoli TaxID=2796471 RepID=A0A934Q987_9MICO|nr:5-formyltetrahydrofolate cyclo-ligase [Leucobacter chromiisoli]MBK0420098.1 5-formyltetrahydrofolate cyclo-ligase [Leucobacter chromiisoli]
MADEIDLEKQRIRDEVRARRAAMGDAERVAARDGITAQLVSLVEAREARSVSCYLPVASEPDTSGFLGWARDRGLDVLLPSAREDGLLDWIRPSWEGMVQGAHGIPEPLGAFLSPMAVGEVDLMIVPACAVDRTGVRLGWGRGYFDKSLGSMERRPPVFAVVHEADFVDSLPSDLHDVPVTGVVTPSRIEYLDDPAEE